MNEKKLYRNISDISHLKKAKKNNNLSNSPLIVIKKNNIIEEDFSDIFSPSIYTKVPRNKYHKLPKGTQVAYRAKIKLKDNEHKFFNVKSAFINEHYINCSGKPGFILCCSKKKYHNCYDDIVALYYFNRDHKVIKKKIKSTKKDNINLFESMLIKVSKLKYSKDI